MIYKLREIETELLSDLKIFPLWINENNVIKMLHVLNLSELFVCSNSSRH